jgi:tetratricopeptide (TPR) repeat protein
MKARVLLPPVYKAADQSSRVQYLYDRAIRVFANGEEEEALGFLEEALRIDPGFADGYEVLGVILGRKGWYHEAIDIFKRLEEFAPHEPMVNTNLSLYYMKLGDKQIAEDHSAIAAQKSMRLGRIKEGATASDVAREQELSRRKDAERKRGMFQQVLDFDPVDPIALFGMGSALSTLGEMALAAGFLERASQVDKNNSAVYLAWGKCLESLQRNEEAMNVYNKGVTIASTRGDLMPLKEMEHRVLLLRSTSGH